MLNQWVNKVVQLVTAISIVGFVAGCGGGGGTGDRDTSGFNGSLEEPSFTLEVVTETPSGAPSNLLRIDQDLVVEVRLLDRGGDAVPNAAIQLTTLVAAISPSNGSAATDDRGYATFTLSYDGSEGGGDVTASYTYKRNDGSDATESTVVGIQSEASNLLLELTTTDEAGDATHVFKSDEVLNVAVKLSIIDGSDATGLEGQLISLSASIGIVGPSNGSAVTDADGIARFTVSTTPLTPELGAGTLEASVIATEKLTISQSRNIEIIAAEPPFSLNLQLFTGSGLVTNELTSDDTVTARVTLIKNDPNVDVSGRLVKLEISPSIAVIAPANGAAVTDSSGIAEFLLNVGDTFGAATVTASFSTDTVSLIATRTLESISVAFDYGLSVRTLDANGSLSNTLTNESDLVVQVRLTDRAGSLINVDGELITLDTGGVSVSGALSAITDNGVAEFILSYDGASGAGVLTATYQPDDDDVAIIATAGFEVLASERYTLNITKSPGSVTPSNSVAITVTLRSPNGGLVNGELVSLDSPISDVSPENGLATTNSSGQASFVLVSNGSDGAGAVKATYTSARGNEYFNTINVTAGPPSANYTLSIGIPSGSTFDETGIDVPVTLTSPDSAVEGLEIELSTDVGSIRPSLSQLTNSSGTATFTLVGDGTQAIGEVTATFTDADGRDYQAIITVQMLSNDPGVAPGTLTLSQSPSIVVIQGVDSPFYPDRVTFTATVKDDTGELALGQTVTFVAADTTGGLGFSTPNGLVDTLDVTTDVNGQAVAVLISGNLPTVVRIDAILRDANSSDNDITVTSSNVTVVSGVVVDTGFSLYPSPGESIPQDPDASAEPLLAANRYTLEVSALDRAGIAVNGATVFFEAQCGTMSAATCTLSTNGTCSVDWLPPTDYRSSVEADNPCFIDGDSAYAKILAYVEGEESFTASDATGYFATGDAHIDTGEPYRDDNRNGAYDAGEFYIDWKNNSARDAVTGGKFGAVESLYNGTACVDGQPAAGSAITVGDQCSNDLVNLWRTLEVTLTPLTPL